MTNEELNVMQRIREVAGISGRNMLYAIPEIISELKIGHDRYEKVRNLTPEQFTEIYNKNIKTGVTFDTLVDKILIRG